MRLGLVRAVPVILAALLGCRNSTLPTEDTLHVSPASRQVIPAYDLHLTFENRSETDVGVGPLGCTSVLQRQTPNGWINADEARACPDQFISVPAGTDLTFSRQMPSISGTFRLEVTVILPGDAPKPRLRVHSPSIRVQWPPDAHPSLTAVVTTERVRVGAELAVQFENNTSHQVAVGELSCVTEYERWTGSTWQRVGSLRMCIELLRLVEGGTSFGYVTPAPDTPGRYRVIFRAYPTSGDGAVDVRSNEFEVKE